MKVHSTNYTDTLILPSEDCRAAFSMPPNKEGTVAAMQFDLLHAAPYTLTGDDLLIAVLATRKGVPDSDRAALRAEVFQKGQPCMRLSPLVKTFGWALHYDGDCKIALVDVGTKAHAALMADDTITKINGMRNKSASAKR